MLFPSTPSAETPKADTHSSASSDEPPPADLFESGALPPADYDILYGTKTTAGIIASYIRNLVFRSGENWDNATNRVLDNHEYPTGVVALVRSMLPLSDIEDAAVPEVPTSEPPNASLRGHALHSEDPDYAQAA